MCFGVLFSMASCLNNNSDGHEHDFSGVWNYDESNHWKSCGVDDCGRPSDVGTHSFAENIDDPENPVIKCTVCGYTKTVEDHPHTFSEGYSSSSEKHWHRCTKIGCAYKNDVVEHIYGNPDIAQSADRIFITDRCVDCGYSMVNVYDISSVIQDGDAWNLAFKTLDLSNYSAKATREKRDKTDYNENSVFIADDAAYYCDNGKLEYYTVNNDGIFTTYVRENYETDKTTPFRVLSNRTDQDYESAKIGTNMHVSFEDNFELFEYDLQKGEYVCQQEISAKIYNVDGTVSDEKIYCYDITVRIIDGKINYISMSYYFENEGRELYNRNLVYYNIGMTNVKIPADVIANAVSK